jgi:uncharacterized membrane protein YoaK (UPF0700 family)
MKNFPSLTLAVVLAAIAGYVDAISYLHFTRLFVSFMSGNSTVFAIDIGQGVWGVALTPVVAIIAFVFGSFLGTLIKAGSGKWQIPSILAAEAFLLVIALTLPRVEGAQALAIIPLAAAMGVQNAALHYVGNLNVSLTYVTGTLVKLGQSLAEAILGRSERWTWSVYAVMWLGLTLGAVGGTLAYREFSYEALLAPAAALFTFSLVLALWTLVMSRPIASGDQKTQF